MWISGLGRIRQTEPKSLQRWILRSEHVIGPANRLGARLQGRHPLDSSICAVSISATQIVAWATVDAVFLRPQDLRETSFHHLSSRDRPLPHLFMSPGSSPIVRHSRPLTMFQRKPRA
jgi:hypothetical protein